MLISSLFLSSCLSLCLFLSFTFEILGLWMGHDKIAVGSS